ncbi:MAG TPA: pitrilysin family protein [Kofleriaceae bacterium]|nr:pitrilysin family protein [Kofleriaceae bacterium]
MVTLRRFASLVPAATAALVAGAFLSSRPSLAEPRAAAVEIPFEQFTLPNGLRVLVHTDRKAPIVAVNVWYHVGSKNEQRGRSGFAHLFEHLMFQGSENHKGEFFEPFEMVGATNQNGTTNGDRTNYFENVPTTAVDVALWMESDRMGHLLGAIDEAKLVEQRGVVQNEKRQNENQPYGRAFTLIANAIFPDNHPYHHTTIGSMTDLDAAKLEDVKNWFRSWYGPNNAVLVLAGDIDLATAKEKVARFFGDIAPSASVPRMAPRVAPRTAATRMTTTDRVPQTRIYKVWNVPQYGTVDYDRLRLLSQVLGGSQSSRLDKRLTFTEKLVDSVATFVQGQEIAGVFTVQADVKTGVDPAKVEAAIDEEIARLATEGPTADEVAQARAVLQASFIRGIERIGGFGGKADVLAQCQTFVGNPSCYRTSLATFESATAAQLKALAAKWIRRGAFTLQIDPGDRPPEVEDPAVANLPPSTIAPAARNLKAVAARLDRSTGVPRPDAYPELRFPGLVRATLSNGVKVVLAERRGLPLVQMSMEFRGAGFASDRGTRSGTASFTLAMLDEGAGDYDALAYAARKESLGAIIGAGGTLDIATIRLSAIKARLDDSLALYADVVTRPRLEDKDIERKRGQWLASIKQEKARPQLLPRRLAGPALFGAGHPYAIALSGTGTEDGITGLRRDDMTRWLAQWIRPDNATLIVVGDTDLAELLPKLEKAFAGWKAPSAALPVAAFPDVKLPAKPRVLLVDQPGAIQSNILVTQLVPPSTDPGAIELETTNGVLGGEFSARLNMNLREDKHWAYGAFAGISNALGQRLWTAGAAVQIDKTAESCKELQREITEYVTGKAPAKPEELSKIQSVQIRALPGQYETGNAVLGTLSSIVLYGRPDDYPQQRANRVAQQTLESFKMSARAIKPSALLWIIVGDLKKIEAPIRAAGLGDVQIVDADGKVVR